MNSVAEHYGTVFGIIKVNNKKHKAMKKFIPHLIILTAVFLSSCEYRPFADFRVSDEIVEINQEIYFTNYSRDAVDFEWDFGDGYVSYVNNPHHRYDVPGIYEVRLAAFNGDEVDYAYETIEVLPPPEPTILEIQVLEYYDEYPVADASIIIYPTLDDWYNETNAIIEVFTDHDGIAVIEGLDPLSYYVDVWHANHNNYTLAEEDVNFIYIPPIVKNATNYFTAWVDYHAGELKSKNGTKKSRIQRDGRKLEDKK